MTDLQKHFFYWILPSVVVGLCMVVYFFDVFGLAFLIAPDFNREFGVLENLQLAILLVLIIVLIRYWKGAEVAIYRWIFAVMFMGTVFVFLEEIDYGLHYWDYLSGKSSLETKKETWDPNIVRNFHNQGKIADYMKLGVYLAFILILVVPIVLKNRLSNLTWVSWIAPNPYFILTLISMLVLNNLAMYIDRHLKTSTLDSLNSNISEFEEVFIYYIILLYVKEKGKMLLFSQKQLNEK